MKKANSQCKKIVAEAKKKYWEEYVKQEVNESDDMHKVYKKVKELNNISTLQSYPIIVNDNIFPNDQEKAESFVDFFAQNSNKDNLPNNIKSFRENKEQEFDKPLNEEDHYLNSDMKYEEFLEALKSFSSNKSAVGIDGISYQMLIHLPAKVKSLLFSLFQKIWNNGVLPSAWKKSIVVPILKQGKSRTSVDSYRPISLTSNCGKFFEKIILNRLLFHCEKYNIIPKQQAGFRKGRSCTDHLVKLSNNIKSQFAKRKSLMACFFDVKKAYDHVWHARLLYKLNKIGITGNMYRYLKSFLINRQICTRVNTSYSANKNVDIGIPQGSIIAPILFSILVHDLPQHISKGFEIVQYADDICIWLKTNLKKNTPKRTISYIQKIFQSELNNLVHYMNENGLQLSGEKTHLILFNNGHNPSFLPIFEISGTKLIYKNETKFLGVYFNRKLSWKYHINYLIDKARKRINFLKLVSAQPWSQNQSTLLQLSLALVRSKLIYGQEIYHSAPKSLLNKLQSIDSRGIKIALGIPISTSTQKCYNEMNILSLNEQRQLATTNYILRSQQIENSVSDDLFIDSDIAYPKQSRNTAYLKPILNYTKEVFEGCDINPGKVKKMPIVPILPPWEHTDAFFDLEYSSVTKSENINILKTEALEHISTKYQHHLKVFTDGSVLESNECGSAYIIPDMNLQKSYHLGKGLSIFSCELYAILFALYQILELNIAISNVVICVDSKSVLQSLQSWDCRARSDLVFEIKHFIHILQTRNTLITFLWIPSHCDIYWNDKVDELAKLGAKVHQTANTISECLLSYNEFKSKTKSYFKQKHPQTKSSVLYLPRKSSKLLLRLRLNTWNTKYVKDVKCICNEEITIQHILFECQSLQLLYMQRNIDTKSFSNINNLLYDQKIIDIINILLESPLAELL